MPEDVKEEDDEPSVGGNEVNEPGADEDEIDEPSTGEDEVDEPGVGATDDSSNQAVRGKSYNLRVDPIRKSQNKWSPSEIKKRLKRGCSKVAQNIKKNIFK
ncbi:hypothetical protein HN51_011354 [Arachis hypogaea]|nr:uncharacterized protein DS421_3g75380 [Arachis hypogaea]